MNANIQTAEGALIVAARAAVADTVLAGGDGLIVLSKKCPSIPGEQHDDRIRAVAAIDILRYLVENYEEVHDEPRTEVRDHPWTECDGKPSCPIHKT